jgi:hypothetical protein
MVLWQSQMADSCTIKRRVPLDREESVATEEDTVTEEGMAMKRRVGGEAMREGGDGGNRGLERRAGQWWR